MVLVALSKTSRLFLGIGPLLLTAGAAAQGLRLNGPLLPEVVGNVQEFQLTADGSRVVYRADQEHDQVFELFSVSADGGGPNAGPLKLNGPLVENGDVGLPYLGEIDFLISPDGTRVVYRADQEVDERFELYSVPIDASAPPVKLNGPLPAGGDVFRFQISPDGALVVYYADERVNDVGELYSVPIDGSSARVRLGARPFLEHRISPDSSRVVYIDDSFELHSVLIDASAPPVRLDQPANPWGSVNTFLLGGDRVVYRADHDIDGVDELYSAPIDGSQSPVKVNGRLVPGGFVSYGFQISPDASRVVYLATQDTPSVLELYSAPIDPGGRRIRRPGVPLAVKLNGPLVAGGSISGPFLIGPDSQRVVYHADQEVDGVHELYSRPLDGSSVPVKLNGPLVAGGDVDELEPDRNQISPDGTRVVYRADQDTDDVSELYSVPIDGSSGPVKLNDPVVPPDGYVGDFAIEPDGDRAVFLTSTYDPLNGTVTPDLVSVPLDGGASPVQFTSNLPDDYVSPWRLRGGRAFYRVHHPGPSFRTELLSAPLDAGTPPLRLHPYLATGPSQRDVSYFLHGPDGRRVAYLADQDTRGVTELYGVRGDGLAPPIKLNAPLAPGSFVSNVASTGTRVLFLVSRNDGSVNLSSVPFDGSASPAQLHAASGPGIAVYRFTVSPDGSRAVYVADHDVDDVLELYSAPADGSAPPVKLSPSPVAGGAIGYLNDDVQVSSDGQRVVYVADHDTDEVEELYSVPIDGSLPPVKLNGPFVAGGDVSFSGLGAARFRISPDASRVVYRADQQVDERFELYSVPIDGSASAVKLNGPLVAGGDVAMAFGTGDFQVSPDGTRVVYRADQDVDERFELYSVPIDAGSSPVKLSAPLVAGGDVSAGYHSSFRISPDSSRVVYRADQELDERFELYSVPIDAGASPVKLNGTPVAGGDVSGALGEFEIAPGGARVVYRADQEVDERHELYSVPIDAGSAPVKLNAPLVASGSVSDFQLAPDGLQLVYRADQETNDVLELFSVALDGSGAPRKVNRALTDGGDASYLYRISPDSSRVVYMADQAADEVQEIWLSYLTGPRSAPPPVGSATHVP